MRTELSESVAVTTYYAAFRGIAGAIEACAQNGKKLGKKPGNAYPTHLSISLPGVDGGKRCENADLIICFRDSKNGGFRKQI